MARTFSITGIEHVRIAQPLAEGADVNGLFLLTNDKEHVASLLSPGFREQAGKMEVDALLDEGTIVAYGSEIVPDDMGAEALHQLLLVWLAMVRRFLQALWLVKDNSACMEFGYLEHPYGQRPAYIWRNFWQGLLSRSNGERSTVDFSQAELALSIDLYTKISNQFFDESQQHSGGRASRWNACLFFLDAARLMNKPGFKVAHYCTCFEALFGTDTVELAHKLSERIACFLESEPNKRLEMFREVKKAYNVRSKVVHGTAKSLDSSPETTRLAIYCDDILRRLLRKILDEPPLRHRYIDGHDKDAGEYLDALVFGVHDSTPGASELQ